MYREDFPNHNMISSELVIWETLWIDHQTKPVPNNIADTLKIADQLTFPNIYTALTILAVLPVTLCSCERSVSVVRRLKTYTRSTMSQDRLNGLASLNIHKEIPVDIDKVLNIFARKHKRRLEMINLLDSNT